MRPLAFLCLAILFPASAAQDQWLHLATPHFEMYTTSGEKRAREVILYFEEVRSFFAQASPVRGVTEFPVRINEGWADVYSTLKPIGKKSMIGDLIPGRVQVLLQQKAGRSPTCFI